MVRINPSINLVVLITVIVSCSPGTQPSSTANLYEEDLSPYRPEVTQIEENLVELPDPESEDTPEYVEPTEHLKVEIDSVLRLKSSRNREAGYIPGFTIQIYTGRSRDEANRAKRIAYDILIDQEPNVFYDQPMFRVKVGRYYSRLEAEKNFQMLKEYFPQALVLPERIPLE